MNQTPTKTHARRCNVFSPEYLQQLRSQVLLSPYLNSNQLSESFTGTKGFSVIFKWSSIWQVEKHFPFLKDYLQATLKPFCNAFYFNVLILESGSRVEEHIDCSICSYDMIYTNPRLVSVFYVDIPPNIQGGELVIKQGKDSWEIEPKTNTLISFLGHLAHGVNQVKSNRPRISLVCEQYKLHPERIKRIPDFKIESGAINLL